MDPPQWPEQQGGDCARAFRVQEPSSVLVNSLCAGDVDAYQGVIVVNGPASDLGKRPFLIVSLRPVWVAIRLEVSVIRC